MLAPGHDVAKRPHGSPGPVDRCRSEPARGKSRKPLTYRWEGLAGKPLSKRDQVKMIGNAVPVNLARALVREVVHQRPAMFGLEVA